MLKLLCAMQITLMLGIGCSHHPRNHHIDENNKIGKLEAPKYKHMAFSGNPNSSSTQLQETLEALKTNHYQVILDLRNAKEIQPGYPEQVRSAGFDYIQVPLLDSNRRIDPRSVDKLEKIHQKYHHQKQLVHCSSGNRAAGWLAVHMIVKHGMEADKAIAFAEPLGLKGGPLKAEIREFANGGSKR